jgi:hypothetical protein
MSWQQFDYPFAFDALLQARSRIGSSALNEQCFIRKQHKCGKMYGASKSCFIACPTNDDLEPMLGLMSEKLAKLGIEPIVAVKERAYGQDIFCTKICGKIIESRFCVVILDDGIKDGTNVPIPNVYYEYGLMTALRKHIIPLQKEDLELAFNIQSYDTIKYSARNIAVELERAIRDAVKLTEAVEPAKTREALADKVILRKMEMGGFDVKDQKWFLADVISDTAFRGFGQHGKKFYVYMGKIDSAEDATTYVDDLSVVVYRTEKQAKNMQAEHASLKTQRQKVMTEREEEARRRDPDAFAMRRRFEHTGASAAALDERIREIEKRLGLMGTIYIAFTVAPGLDIAEFLKASASIIAVSDRYRLAYSQGERLELGDVAIDFSTTQH